MGVQQQKIFVHDLEMGMFVSDLDRPWHQTPFPIQGFHIRSQDDIRALTSHCKWVSVDVAESRAADVHAKGQGEATGRRTASKNKRQVLKLPPLNVREPVFHPRVTTLRKELKLSRKLMVDAEASLQRLFESVRNNQSPDLADVAQVTRNMVSSVIRNPDAVLWLSRTRQYDDFTYQHALNTAVWALICGRNWA